jgi:hypothetical protein
MIRARHAVLVLATCLTIASGAEAAEWGQSTLRTTGVFDVWSLFGALGRPGWLPAADDGAAPPPSFAGLVFGSMRIDEPTRMADRPWPGLVAVRTPIAWFDSLSAAGGGEGAWQGFNAGLVNATAAPLGAGADSGQHRAVGEFSFVRGSSAEEQTSFSIARLDSLLPLRIEAVSVSRGAIGVMERSGRHLWGGSAGAVFGVHRFAATFTQRGSGSALANGDDEAGTGLGGSGSWTWQRPRDRMTVELARGYHHLESVGPALPFSRRDADEIAAEFDWSFDDPTTPHAVRLSLCRTEVDRTTEGEEHLHAREDAAWLAVRAQRALWGGRLSGALGGGWSRAVDAAGWAPSLEWAGARGGFELRALGERIVTPVWSDLVPGIDPFLQQTWAGGIDVARRTRHWSATLGGRVGLTDDRALVGRDPMTEIWLRRGVVRDPDPYPFQLVTAGFAVHGGWLAAGAEGFGLGRGSINVQPQVDPGYGGRVFVEGSFRVFANDLGVRMRVEGAGIGPRESEAFPPRELNAFATLDAVVIATLADAVLTFSMRNLADVAQPQVWLDPRTGVEALGPGREMHFGLSWRLFD